LSTGPNDSNGYVLPSYEQYPSRFPAHAGRLPSVDGPVPQNDRGNGSYEGRFSNFGEPAPQDNVSSGSYEPYLVSQNIGFGGSYDQYLSRFPAHANRFPNAVETPPQTNEPRGNGPITWNGSPRPVPATNLTATQSVEVHYGRNYVDPTSLGLGFGDDQISYHFSRFEAGAFTVGPANAQQHHLNAQASHDWHHVQGVQGRRGQHEWVYHYSARSRIPSLHATAGPFKISTHLTLLLQAMSSTNIRTYIPRTWPLAMASTNNKELLLHTSLQPPLATLFRLQCVLSTNSQPRHSV
jgi:hypothetical protein